MNRLRLTAARNMAYAVRASPAHTRALSQMRLPRVMAAPQQLHRSAARCFSSAVEEAEEDVDNDNDVDEPGEVVLDGEAQQAMRAATNAGALPVDLNTMTMEEVKEGIEYRQKWLLWLRRSVRRVSLVLCVLCVGL